MKTMVYFSIFSSRNLNFCTVIELHEVRLLRYSAQLHVVNPAACDMLRPRILANRVNSRYLLVANYRDNFFVVKVAQPFVSI
jgi:hypothetical protein